ncbi:hypothetical protein J7L06_08155 [Candidatus Bathyarchaeota archaeon]|nr:hypothetical protein [Candidatus Bathyarchaeota archaeon]
MVTLKFSRFEIFFLQRVKDGDSIPERKPRRVESEIIIKKSLKEMRGLEDFDHLLESLIEYVGSIDRSISRLEECVELLKREIYHKNLF